MWILEKNLKVGHEKNKLAGKSDQEARPRSADSPLVDVLFQEQFYFERTLFSLNKLFLPFFLSKVAERS